MNNHLHFLLLFQLCRNLRNIPLGGRILGKSKVIITVASTMTSSEGPFLVLPRAHPTLHTPLSVLLWELNCTYSLVNQNCKYIGYTETHQTIAHSRVRSVSLFSQVQGTFPSNARPAFYIFLWITSCNTWEFDIKCFNILTKKCAKECIFNALQLWSCKALFANDISLIANTF